MLTLSLLRHAKSSWDDPDLDDHERGLAPRGVKAAPLIGAYLKREKLVPDLVLCSDAVRTRATLALVLAELGEKRPLVRYETALYLAAPETLLDVVAAHAGNHRHVMVLGHNPGLHALALELAGGGDRAALKAMATKYPTGALAVLRFDERQWKAIGAGMGRLERFVTPKDLRA